ncbi:MAG: hypothetical protein PHO80_00410 [Candidatus Gracilibacteria bacterium]|nr:hypothetical protein [Candidatus Gracilibacteria bacterium]MDD4530002.1 hypothetical protein [Candidatus Gracilibacteria bacterium]
MENFISIFLKENSDNQNSVDEDDCSNILKNTVKTECSIMNLDKEFFANLEELKKHFCLGGSVKEANINLNNHFSIFKYIIGELSRIQNTLKSQLDDITFLLCLLGMNEEYSLSNDIKNNEGGLLRFTQEKIDKLLLMNNSNDSKEKERAIFEMMGLYETINKLGIVFNNDSKQGRVFSSQIFLSLIEKLEIIINDFDFETKLDDIDLKNNKIFKEHINFALARAYLNLAEQEKYIKIPSKKEINQLLSKKDDFENFLEYTKNLITNEINKWAENFLDNIVKARKISKSIEHKDENGKNSYGNNGQPSKETFDYFVDFNETCILLLYNNKLKKLKENIIQEIANSNNISDKEEKIGIIASVMEKYKSNKISTIISQKNSGNTKNMQINIGQKVIDLKYKKNIDDFLANMQSYLVKKLVYLYNVQKRDGKPRKNLKDFKEIMDDFIFRNDPTDIDYKVVLYLIYTFENRDDLDCYYEGIVNTIATKKSTGNFLTETLKNKVLETCLLKEKIALNPEILDIIFKYCKDIPKNLGVDFSGVFLALMKTYLKLIESKSEYRNTKNILENLAFSAYYYLLLKDLKTISKNDFELIAEIGKLGLEIRSRYMFNVDPNEIQKYIKIYEKASGKSVWDYKNNRLLSNIDDIFKSEEFSAGLKFIIGNKQESEKKIGDENIYTAKKMIQDVWDKFSEKNYENIGKEICELFSKHLGGIAQFHLVKKDDNEPKDELGKEKHIKENLKKKGINVSERSYFVKIIDKKVENKDGEEIEKKFQSYYIVLVYSKLYQEIIDKLSGEGGLVDFFFEYNQILDYGSVVNSLISGKYKFEANIQLIRDSDGNPVGCEGLTRILIDRKFIHDAPSFPINPYYPYFMDINDDTNPKSKDYGYLQKENLKNAVYELSKEAIVEFICTFIHYRNNSNAKNLKYLSINLDKTIIENWEDFILFLKKIKDLFKVMYNQDITQFIKFELIEDLNFKNKEVRKKINILKNEGFQIMIDDIACLKEDNCEKGEFNSGLIKDIRPEYTKIDKQIIDALIKDLPETEINNNTAKLRLMLEEIFEETQKTEGYQLSGIIIEGIENDDVFKTIKALINKHFREEKNKILYQGYFKNGYPNNMVDTLFSNKPNTKKEIQEMIDKINYVLDTNFDYEETKPDDFLSKLELLRKNGKINFFRSSISSN